MYAQVQFAFFSDCFTYSMPMSFGTRIYPAVADMLRKFLLHGFCARGGIAAVNLYHSKQAIFGPALVCAHSLEKPAGTPRIIVDKSALDCTGWEEGLLVTDHDGRSVVDPVPRTVHADDMDQLLRHTYELDAVAVEIQRQVNRLTDGPREKWRALALLYARSLNKYGKPAEALIKAFTDLASD